MDKEQVTKLIGKIKETVGENNYKLALAITGHRPGKIRDITMASKDGELLLEYIDNLEQQVKKQKEAIDKATNELFILKDMIYKPETRQENFEIQRKISSIIKRLNGKEVSE